jgi:hypothetical protein
MYAWYFRSPGEEAHLDEYGRHFEFEIFVKHLDLSVNAIAKWSVTGLVDAKLSSLIRLSGRLSH